LNVTVTVETIASCTTVTLGRGGGVTRPSPSPFTVRGRTSLVAFAVERPPELGERMLAPILALSQLRMAFANPEASAPGDPG
jgi:hypothetical protein